jgi:hypothetical protein
MKYLAIIFSVYMTFLSLMPCQDKDDKLTNMVTTTISKDKACEQTGQEVCPPFCTCSCCSTARQLTSNPVLAVFTKAVVRIYPAYAIPAVQKQVIKIWQPPQIA